jgi:polyisoprenoid-binding protein YceI
VNFAFDVYRTFAFDSILERMETTPTRTADTQWTVDSMHSTVGFGIRHLMITNMRGVFQRVSGTVRFDARRPETAEIVAEIPVASIDTRVAPRDAHLRGPEFFDAERYPTITFRSKRARVGAANSIEVIGDLTIRDTTREVVLAVVDVSGEQADHNGAIRIGASATARIKRSDFGMTYNKVLEAGGVALSDEVTLTFDMSLVKAAPPAGA